MKNKSLKPGLPYLYRRQLHGKVSLDTTRQSLKPESEWERPENVIEDILRWADDGGQMLDLGSFVARSNSDTARDQVNE
jgi:hypothetical protein